MKYFHNVSHIHRIHTIFALINATSSRMMAPWQLFSDFFRLQKWSGQAWVLRFVSSPRPLLLIQPATDRSCSSYTVAATAAKATMRAMMIARTSYASSGAANRWLRLHPLELLIRFPFKISMAVSPDQVVSVLRQGVLILLCDGIDIDDMLGSSAQLLSDCYSN